MSNVVTLQAGGKLAAINPQTFEDVQRIAKMAVVAGLSPRDRKDDDETAIAKATMAIMQGLECDIPPIQALQNIAIINGKAMMYGDLLTALLWSKGFKVKKWIVGEGDAMVGHGRITRPDGEIIEKSYSVAQAKRARLWDERQTVRKQWNGNWEEKPNDSPWFRFAERMLEWRAFGFCVKDGASDATHGMLVREEADPDFNSMVDVTPKKPEAPPPPIAFDGVDEIPTIPDAVDQVPAEEAADDPLPNPSEFARHYRSELDALDGEERAEFIAANADVLKRLPADMRKELEDLVKGES